MIYLIRHGQSKYNQALKQLRKKYQEDYMSKDEYFYTKFSKDFLDVDLSEQGVKQCLECKDKMKDIDVDLIIVSPLRRALQTCHQIFGDHKSNPAVIVHPQFRQVLHSSNDIGSKLQQSMHKFAKFDFSLISDPSSWYLQNIQNQQIRQRLLSKLVTSKEDSQLQNKKAVQVSLQFMLQHFKTRQLAPQSKQAIKRLLPCINNQIEFLHQCLQKHKKIIVISHSQNLRQYIGHKILNCQIYSISQEKLKGLKL